MSMALVFGALAWTYSVFPEQVAFDFASSGLAEIYVNKEHVFYITMGFFILNNVFITALAKRVPKIDASRLPVPRSKEWAAKHRELFNELLINWIYVVVAAINTMLGLSLFALATINSNSYKLDVFDFAWVFYLGLAFMIIVFLLPLRLLRTPAPQEEDTY